VGLPQLGYSRLDAARHYTEPVAGLAVRGRMNSIHSPVSFLLTRNHTHTAQTVDQEKQDYFKLRGNQTKSVNVSTPETILLKL
jgi:hypothetical protein